MAVLNSQKREEMRRRNEGFRRRPRKSSKPCRARTNSIADLFRFGPFCSEETEPSIKKSSAEKGKKMVEFERNSKSILLPFSNQELPCKDSCGNLHVEAKFHPKTHKIKSISKKSAKDRVFLPTAELPLELKSHIRELGATGDPVLVIEKRLFPSDVSANLQRFSIPISQVYNHKFLTEVERKRFNHGGKQLEIDAILVEPSLAESNIRFKKWYTSGSGMYILNNGWNDVVIRNGLKEGNLVQLWSFRKESQLCFALFRLC